MLSSLKETPAQTSAASTLLNLETFKVQSMRRLFQPFVLVLTALLGTGYAYIALRFFDGAAARLGLLLPFAFVWLIPVLYWAGEREVSSRFGDLVHFVGYLCMGFLSFFMVFAMGCEGLGLIVTLFGGSAPAFIDACGSYLLLFATLGVGLGALIAMRGLTVKHVEITLDNLPAALHGYSIVQISDLHVGPTIRRSYVERVVAKANELKADMVAMTGDLVDGSVELLSSHVAPLAHLTPKDRVYFITGNHEYYSDAAAWVEHFKAMGMHTLLNESTVITKNGARILIGGVIDPAAKMKDPSAKPDPIKAAVGEADFRILLAHNPKLAPQGARAGFDLQLSGHTHAGQFFPWTLVTRLIHAPHFVGLSRSGKMWVYVSAGTGTWGPPNRLGTRPELTHIRLIAARSP